MEQEQSPIQEKVKNKEIVKISYTGSGVKTLKGFGEFFFALSGLCALAALVALSEYKELIIISFSASLGCLLSGAICTGMASIAKTALMKRTLLEREYSFDETSSK